MSSGRSRRADRPRRRRCGLGDGRRRDPVVRAGDPRGVGSDTGVAGLTLGGGTGYPTPKHGFAADNLRAIDVVAGRGDRVTATLNRNAELLWAARGGGTVGVVTAFEFDLHPLDHDVPCAESWLPMDRAREVLREYRAYHRDASDEACVFPYFGVVPSTSAFPAARHGDPAIVAAGGSGPDTDAVDADHAARLREICDRHDPEESSPTSVDDCIRSRSVDSVARVGKHTPAVPLSLSEAGGDSSHCA